MATSTALRVQVELQSGKWHRTCWVEPRCKVGDRISLKNSPEPHRLWDVLSVSQPISAESINWGFKNDI